MRYNKDLKKLIEILMLNIDSMKINMTTFEDYLRNSDYNKKEINAILNWIDLQYYKDDADKMNTSIRFFLKGLEVQIEDCNNGVDLEEILPYLFEFLVKESGVKYLCIDENVYSIEHLDYVAIRSLFDADLINNKYKLEFEDLTPEKYEDKFAMLEKLENVRIMGGMKNE